MNMLNSLKTTGKNMGLQISRAWEGLTHFARNKDEEKPGASFSNGVLTVRLPKVGDDKAKSISVS